MVIPREPPQGAGDSVETTRRCPTPVIWEGQRYSPILSERKVNTKIRIIRIIRMLFAPTLSRVLDEIGIDWYRIASETKQMKF